MQISCRHFPRQKKKKALTVIFKYHVQLQVNNSEAMGHFATLGFSNGEQMCRKHKWQHLCRRVWYSDPKKTCACAYLFYFCALGEFQLFPEKAVTATTPCIQSFKWKFLHASVDKDFICIRLGQKNLRWKEGMCFRRYKVLVKHILNIVWLESIIGASSAERLIWGQQQEGLEMEPHNLMSPAFFSPDGKKGPTGWKAPAVQ